MTASSPMAPSLQSASSDALPTLTAGTTAPTSPSPLSPPSPLRSPSLSPAPEPSASSSNKKRKAPAADTPAAKKKPRASNATSTPSKKAAAKDEEKPEKGTYCHQCRTRCEPDKVLRCTKLRKYTKGTPARACNLAWCERDLVKRYEVDPDAVRKRGRNVPAGELEKHDEEKEYVFACPCCEDECQNSTCRIKKGLKPLGDVVKMAAEQGVTPLELVKQINAEGPEPTAKSRADASALFDGELSDPDAPKAAPKKKAAAKKEADKPKAKAATAKKGKEAAAPKKIAAKGKEKEKEKATKTATKKAPAKEAKAKPEPPRYVWPKADPPVITNLDTRLSREEAEQRMYLREFVCRFRVVLGLPDRSLGPLDDFDHPLSEATVRQIASAFLGLIVADGGHSQDQGDLEMDSMIPEIDDLREELRYADLARFAQIYNQVAEMLGLTMPPDPTQQAKERNERAMRAILDLGADEPAPSWAIETAGGSSSRRGASRIPPPSEIVRMLLALADHVMRLEDVKWHMDPMVLYSAGDAARQVSNETKAENKRWEAEKAKLNAARVRCKNAAETKAAKAKFEERQHEHFMRTRYASLTYRITAARKAMRFEPLGTDLDGRLYYTLTPRLIDEERYRPSLWARGVLIWGKGWEQPGDEVPNLVERWMIVNTAEDIRQLQKYLAYRWRTKYDEMEQAELAEEKAKGKKKTPVKPAAGRTPSRASINGHANGTPNGRRAITAINGDGDDDSDAESDLSSPPDDGEYRAELLALLDPPGYEPSMEKIKDEQWKLESGVTDVALSVDALEWKGIRA